MSKKSSIMAFVFALAMAGSVAMACDKDAAKTACSGKAVAKAMATAVTYRVGDTETPCPKTAAALAERDHSKVTYVAAGEAFETETEAKTALAKKIEAAIDEMLQVRYAVGDECVSCPMAAGAMAKKAGKAVKYRAVGREFDSEDDAKAAVARAKAVLASHAAGNGAGCCEAAKAAMLAKAEGAKSACSAHKTAQVAAAKTGSSSCQSGAKATAVASSGSSCHKTATSVAGTSCPDAKKIDEALAAAKSRYEAVLASADIPTEGQG